MFLPILSDIEKAVQAGLDEHAKAVLERSNELAPKDTGDMIASGFVSVADLTAQVGYRDFVARYQHERLDYSHDDGQAKFLETATDELTDQLAPTIGRHVRGVLGG